MNTLVINDQTNHIKHDQHSKVENDLFHEEINNADYAVEKLRKTVIGTAAEALLPLATLPPLGWEIFDHTVVVKEVVAL